MFENRPATDLLIGRSTIRQRILALLVSDPATRLHLREIQRRAGTSPGTASRELAKLVGAGLIEREAEGAQVYFQASATPRAIGYAASTFTGPALQVRPAPTRTLRL